jgi:hypothetical protein
MDVAVERDAIPLARATAIGCAPTSAFEADLDGRMRSTTMIDFAAARC